MANSEDLEYFRALMLTLDDLRNDTNFCDFTLTAGTETIMAHKSVLAAASPYFRSMITNGFKESKELHVDLKELEFASVKSVIDYLYTSKIDINEKSVLSILDAASIMQISSLEQRCICYLEEGLNCSNCVSILNTEIRPELVQEAKHYILKNFCQINHEQIVQLSLEQLIDIIKDENLAVDNEYTVFEISKVWAGHNNREEHMADIVKQLRWTHMSTLDLWRASNDPIILSNERCREYLFRITMYYLNPRDISPILNEKFFRARDSSPTCLYYFGGGRPTMKYNPVKDEWTRTSLPIVDQQCFSLAAWNDVIYFIGGLSKKKVFNSPACYNSHTGILERMPPLKEARTNPGVAMLGGNPLIIGGERKTAELFQPHANDWINYPGPTHLGHSFGCVTLDDHIYILGGTATQGEGRNLSFPVFRSVERLEGDSWKRLAPMITARSSFGCTTFNGHIYVVGGYDGKASLSLGERYDPQRDEWEPIAPMSEARYCLCLVALDQLIFAVGGCTALGLWSDKVEAYDPVKNVWSKRSPMMLDYNGRAVAFKGLRLW